MSDPAPEYSNRFKVQEWDYLKFVRKTMPVLSNAEFKLYKLDPDDEGSLVGRYLLPKELRPNKIFEIVLVGEDDSFITFYISEHDMYLRGFKTQNGVYYKFEKGDFVAVPEGAVVRYIRFGNSYDEMFGAMEKDPQKRFGLLLGKTPLLNAIKTLNREDIYLEHRKPDMARSLLVFVIMFCEASRFGPLAFRCSCMEGTYQLWMWELFDKWVKLSRELEAYRKSGVLKFKGYDLSVPKEAQRGWELGEFNDRYDVLQNILARCLPPAKLDKLAKVLYTMAVLKNVDHKKAKKGDISPERDKGGSGSSNPTPRKGGQGWEGGSSSKHGGKSTEANRAHGHGRKRHGA
ncbi:hypothetical protein Tsubulata_049560 [Turnera subulata]|uniref:rRNA N-glycosylase n=1 Tax=Turnera subulata TaxID=218843 RepID=A0A9Q0FRS7_9ROSI|nr:hypothetical protein Tsubulata_049560 [Turnera subulata]